MAKVFVTGVAGFLGSHVAERFRDLGWEVVGIDNLQGGREGNVPAGVRFEVRDCLERESYLPLMAGSDLVYHCACAAYDGLSLFSPAFVYRHTVQATVEVASAAVASGVSRVVHCSSMARYGALPAPFTEDMEPAPVSPYGFAKWCSELIVANLAETHGGEYAIAVPHSIIGPRQRFDDPYRNVASIMINRMLRGLQPVIYGDGSSRRCFSFVTDVLDCLERMGSWPAAAGETINVGPDEGAVTILGLAEEIASLLGVRLDPIFVAPRPLEVREATCSAGKARRLLGYETATCLRDGLISMIDWIERNGPRDFQYDRDIEIVTAATPDTWVDKLL
ncbi:MAG: NAD-dependent epimerase/dehydratase family protein [Acidimicrobiales bacterium]